MTGVIWLTQVLVYPQFFAVPDAQWNTYHRRHTVRISIVVIPLMLTEAATGLWAAFTSWPWTTLRMVALVCLAAVWLSTFALQVPLHERLSKGPGTAEKKRLLATNWIRTVAWTVKAAVTLAMPRV